MSGSKEARNDHAGQCMTQVTYSPSTVTPPSVDVNLVRLLDDLGLPLLLVVALLLFYLLVRNANKVNDFLNGHTDRKLKRAKAKKFDQLDLTPGIVRFGRILAGRGRSSTEGSVNNPALEQLSEDVIQLGRRLDQVESALHDIHITVRLLEDSRGQALVELHNKHTEYTAFDVGVRIVGKDGQRWGPAHVSRDLKLDVPAGGRVFVPWPYSLSEDVEVWTLSLSWRDRARLVQREVPLWTPGTIKPE